MDGVSLSDARQAATLAAHKPCSKTKFVQWSVVVNKNDFDKEKGRHSLYH